MQVDVGLRLGRLGGALGGGVAVRRGEVVVGLEEGGALGGEEGDGLLDEGVESGGLLWGSCQLSGSTVDAAARECQGAADRETHG